MAQIPVQKVRFYITATEAEAFVSYLHKTGAVELIPKNPDESLVTGEIHDFTHRHESARLESAIEFLAPFHVEKDPFKTMFEGTRVVTNATTLETVTTEYPADATLAEVETLQARLQEIAGNEKALADEERVIRTWERLNFPLNTIQDSATTRVFPVRGTTRIISLLTTIIESVPSAHIHPVSENALLVVAHVEAAEQVTTIINEHDVELLQLPNSTETPTEALTRIADHRAILATERETLTAKAASLAATELSSLKQIADVHRWRATERDTAGTMFRTAHVSVVDTWVPTPSFTAITADLEQQFPTAAYELLTTAEDEIPPTVIENRGFAQPFEFVTRLYGVPSHKDLDPTPFLAVFFFIFFGLCLSDVGYGAVLMALTGAALYRYNVTGGMKSLLTTLFFGGLGAFIVGIIYGGYFGVAATDIHPALASLQLFDPIGNPMPVFYLALAFGVLQVIVGIVLDIVRTAKNNDVVNGILDNGPWLLMFLVIIAYVVAGTSILPSNISEFILNQTGLFAIIAAILISVTKARTGKGPIDMVLKGVLALYGGVNYFSDILSYSRLLALGLATSALGFSINLIASIVGGDTLGIGTIFAILILIAGHTLNVTLSTLGAFIHSSRLQYVEFFGKFLTGTGRPFTPFKRDEKHTSVLPDTPT